MFVLLCFFYSLDDLSSALETENKESEKIKNAMKEKEEKVFSLTERLQGLMEELALLENRFVRERPRLNFVKAFEMSI